MRTYRCPRCGIAYAHDQAYHHAVFACADRTGDKGRESHQKGRLLNGER